MSINKIFKEDIVKTDESKNLLKKLQIEGKQLDDSFRFVYIAYIIR